MGNTIGKIFRRTGMCLIALAVLAGFANPAAAQEGQGFRETFDTTELAGWEHGPDVLVRDGVLSIGPAQFAARPGAWQDFELSFRLRFTGEGETHINYQAADQGSYLLILRGEGLVLVKNLEHGEPQELGRTEGISLVENEWGQVSISISGGDHKISINGADNLTASDSSPLGPGAIVFASMGQRTSELDDVILQVNASLPGQDPAAPVAPVNAPTAEPGPVTPEDGAWQDLLRNLSASQGSTFEMDVFVINLILAVVASFILSRVYIHWGGSLSNRRKFAANFMLVTITTTFIILVVRSSIALSLGLVGALSIIRFRAAIKEPEELAYLFFAISLGIGLGDNQRAVTLVTLAVVIVVIGLARIFRQSQADMNLHLAITSRGPEKVNLQQVMDVLARHTAKLRLLRYDETAEILDLSFVVEFRHISNLNQARQALQTLSPALQVSFLDNKGIW